LAATASAHSRPRQPESRPSVRAIYDHSRNLDDEQLLALKKNRGVIQVVAFASYIKSPTTPERTAAQDVLRREFGLSQGVTLGGRGFGAGRGGRGGNPFAQLNPEKRAELQRRLADVDQRYPPPPRATVKDFVDHIDYAVRKIGVDHVGISSDFDGGGGIDGWDGADETFNVTLELVRRGYTEPQIAKIWSGNLLRVLDDVQRIARDLQNTATTR
jgi:membrane dipeptidase